MQFSLIHVVLTTLLAAQSVQAVAPAPHACQTGSLRLIPSRMIDMRGQSQADPNYKIDVSKYDWMIEDNAGQVAPMIAADQDGMMLSMTNGASKDIRIVSTRKFGFAKISGIMGNFSLNQGSNVESSFKLVGDNSDEMAVNVKNTTTSSVMTGEGGGWALVGLRQIGPDLTIPFNISYNMKYRRVVEPMGIFGWPDTWTMDNSIFQVVLSLKNPSRSNFFSVIPVDWSKFPQGLNVSFRDIKVQCYDYNGVNEVAAWPVDPATNPPMKEVFPAPTFAGTFPTLKEVQALEGYAGNTQGSGGKPQGSGAYAVAAVSGLSALVAVAAFMV